MIKIRYVEEKDKEFWFQLDAHFSEKEFQKKVRDAQHFYRKIGYKDCGGFTVDISGYEQPMELFLSKAL